MVKIFVEIPDDKKYCKDCIFCYEDEFPIIQDKCMLFKTILDCEGRESLKCNRCKVLSDGIDVKY